MSISKGSVQQMERHESLYFIDGNVVLLASHPDGHELLFRVHKSVLSSHSPIFKDMFEICNPPDGKSDANADNVYDGAPLVHMSDNANHLESVLKILYYKSILPWTPHSDYPLLIAPVLNLAWKYGIDSLRDQIIGHIESNWPKTLKEWDKLERDIKNMANDSDAGRVDDRFPEPASAISLARQFDIPNILPAAFYHLSRISVLDDWDKTHADPSLPIRNPTKCTARWNVLSARDFHCLLLGKVQLREFLCQSVNVEELRHVSASKPGKDSSECQGGKALWKDMSDRCSEYADPLALLAGSAQFANGGTCCNVCKKQLEAKFPTVRAKIWEKLGDLFHLTNER